MPLPDAVLPKEPEADNKLWSACPGCGKHEIGVVMRGFSMKQFCAGCGLFGPELHFLGEPASQTLRC